MAASKGERRSQRLTKTVCESLKPKAARYRVSDEVARGLKFVVEPSGRKYWTVRYVTASGKNTEKIIGEWPALLVEPARDEAGRVRDQARKGGDPVEEARADRKAQRAARVETFSKLAAAYFAASERGTFGGKGGPKAASTIAKERQYSRCHLEPRLGVRPISAITRNEIVGHLEEIAVKSGNAAANSALELTRRVFAYGRHKELIEHNPSLEIPRYSTSPRDVVASDDDLKKLWAELDKAKALYTPKRKGTDAAEEERAREGYMSATVLQIALLTLQRRGEIVAINKRDIDWAKKLWTIPAINKKERRRGLVPLSDWACEILRDAFERSGGEWAFAGRKSGEPIAPKTVTRFMARLRERTKLADLTPHDLRRTGRTRLTSDELSIDEVTAERVLNHVVGSRQQRAYDWQMYTTQKRNALNAWADELRRLVEGDAPKDNVVSLRPNEAKRLGETQAG